MYIKEFEFFRYPYDINYIRGYKLMEINQKVYSAGYGNVYEFIFKKDGETDIIKRVLECEIAEELVTAEKWGYKCCSLWKTNYNSKDYAPDWGKKIEDLIYDGYEYIDESCFYEEIDGENCTLHFVKDSFVEKIIAPNHWYRLLRTLIDFHEQEKFDSRMIKIEQMRIKQINSQTL